MVQQLNATTCTVFSLPKKFTCEKYAPFLDSKNLCATTEKNLTLEELVPDEDIQAHLEETSAHGIQMILLTYAPRLWKSKKYANNIQTSAADKKPSVRPLGHVAKIESAWQTISGSQRNTQALSGLVRQ
ncbi:hypothetical protein M422DRAFT_242944 [Sphaerobolus stellatus SS14]|nr:hypothetical protein M422DRAFT_242944 [Sphaerobolus stellatus SS14]